jgi:hypothetical protein
MFTSQLGTHIASTVASDLATSALPGAPVRSPSGEAPAPPPVGFARCQAA